MCWLCVDLVPDIGRTWWTSDLLMLELLKHYENFLFSTFTRNNEHFWFMPIWSFKFIGNSVNQSITNFRISTETWAQHIMNPKTEQIAAVCRFGTIDVSFSFFYKNRYSAMSNESVHLKAHQINCGYGRYKKFLTACKKHPSKRVPFTLVNVIRQEKLLVNVIRW